MVKVFKTRVKVAFPEESDAFHYIHKVTPFSVSHATKYEGWSIKKVK